MLEPEVATLRDILLAMPVTNSVSQATRWAREIIGLMRRNGCDVEMRDTPESGVIQRG